AGVNVMLWSVGAVTVKVVAPLTVPAAAVMVVVPAPTPPARPRLEIAAAAVLEEVHATAASTCIPDENVPVATNCCEPLVKIEGFAGDTEIESSPAGVRTGGW